MSVFLSTVVSLTIVLDRPALLTRVAPQNALAVRQDVFGGVNAHVAVAHEKLAYAYRCCRRLTQARYVQHVPSVASVSTPNASLPELPP